MTVASGLGPEEQWTMMEGRERAEEQNSVAIKVGKGVDELTFRTGAECMQRSNINTANVKASRWGGRASPKGFERGFKPKGFGLNPPLNPRGLV